MDNCAHGLPHPKHCPDCMEEIGLGQREDGLSGRNEVIRSIASEPEVLAVVEQLRNRGFHIHPTANRRRASLNGWCLDFWLEPHNIGKAYAVVAGFPASQQRLNQLLVRSGGVMAEKLASIDVRDIEERFIAALVALAENPPS
jgi:hypothetical protein